MCLALKRYRCSILNFNIKIGKCKPALLTFNYVFNSDLILLKFTFNDTIYLLR